MFTVYLSCPSFGQATPPSSGEDKDSFFGPKLSTTEKEALQGQPISIGEVIDGAKNPELIPELYRWDEFRGMVLQLAREMTVAKVNGGKWMMNLSYKDKILSILGTKFRDVSERAIKCDGDMRRSNEQLSQTTTPEQEPVLESFEHDPNARVEQFKKEVTKVLDAQQSSELEEYISKEVVKRVRFLKLPAR